MTPLERLRRANGLSREKLAAKASVTPRTVYRAERTTQGTSPLVQRSLAEALGGTVADLFPEANSARSWETDRMADAIVVDVVIARGAMGHSVGPDVQKAIWDAAEDVIRFGAPVRSDPKR